MDIPVFLVCGFLESGKTSFILETISDPEFETGERTLLICCEEGEVEYDINDLKMRKVSLVTIEDEEELTTEFLRKCNTKYKPKRVLIEFNGTWSKEMLMNVGLPSKWVLAQVITTVDATTFSVYMNNMKAMMADNIGQADLIIFNRCNQNTDKKVLRRSIKLLNRQAQIIYEAEDGTVGQDNEDMPFDINADIIEIEDDDYGLWYMDASDNGEKYDGKKVKIKGMVYRPKGFPSGYFVPGRFAMTCCAEDMAFVGFIAKCDKEDQFANKEWVTVIADVKNEYNPKYNGEGPILYVTSIEKANEPEEKIVYFS